MASIEIHPSAEDLKAFSLGQLSDPLWTQVEGHVANCLQCQEQAFQVPDDPLVVLLRTAHGEQSSHALTAHDLPQSSTFPPTVDSGDIPVPQPSQSSDSGDEIPESLGNHERYRLLRLLGIGGMGAVYEAEHRVMQRRVAVKVINRALTTRPSVVERFRREVRAAARLSHPNIVHAYDAEHAVETHFLVMEYVPGITLTQHLRQHGPLPIVQACDFIRQAALGLQHAHERGMIHRDIKPENLLLTPDGCVKVLDFGLAALTVEQSEGGLTDENAVMGTPDYMAPEQAENPHSADIRADVYSLGCSLFRLLTGSVPYPAGTVVQKLLAHRECPLPSPRKLRPEIPEELAAVVVRMLAKKPADRYRTPGEVAAALAPFTVPKTEPEKPKRRFPWFVAAGLLGVLLILLGAIIYRIQTDNGEVVVTSHDPNVEITFLQAGKAVRIHDLKTGKQLTLPTGDYDVAVDKPDEFTVKTNTITISRGRQTLVTIERKPKPVVNPVPGVIGENRPDAASPFADLPEKPGLICRLPRRSESALGNILLLSPDSRLALFAVDAARWEVERFQVVEVATKKQVRTIGRGGERLTPATFTSPTTVVVGRTQNQQTNSFQEWDLTTGKDRLLGVPEDHLWPAHMSSTDGGRFLSFTRTTGTGAGSASVLDLRSGKVAVPVPASEANQVIYTRMMPGGQHAVSLIYQDVAKRAPELGVHRRAPELQIDDVESGKVKRFVLAGTVHHYDPPAVAGEGLIALTYWDREKTFSVEYRRIRGGDVVRRVTLPGPALNFGMSENGRRVAILTRDNRIVAYDLPSGRVAHRFGFGPEERTRWDHMGLAPDGRVAMSMGGSDIELYRLPDPVIEKIEPEGAPEGPTGKIEILQRVPIRQGRGATTTAIAPDGRLFAAGFHQSDTGFVWDGATGKEMYTVEGELLAFTADGKRLVSAGQTGRLHIHDAATGNRLNQIALTGAAWGLLPLPNRNRILAYTADRKLWLIDVEGGTILQTWDADDSQVAALADGRTLFIKVNGLAEHLVWDVVENQPLKQYAEIARYHRVYGFVDLDRLAVVGDGRQDWIVSFPDGKPIRKVPGLPEPSVAGGRSAAPGTDWLRAYGNSQLRYFNYVTGQELAAPFTFPNMEGMLRDGVIWQSPDARHACVATNGSVYLLRLPVDSPELPTKPGAFRTIPRLSPETGAVPKFSSDSRLVLVAREIQPSARVDSFRVHEVATGRVLRDLDMPGIRMTDAEFTPDGRSVLTGSVAGNGVYRLHLWDLSTGERRELTQFGRITAWPGNLQFSPDGTRLLLALGITQNRVEFEVYDIATGKRLVWLDIPVDRGPCNAVCCFTPDGKKVVTTVSYQLPEDKPEAERTEIWLTALDGTGTKRVPAGSAYAEGQPFFDPVTDEIGSIVGDRKRSWVQYRHPETGNPTRKLEFPRGLPACEVSTRNGSRFLVSEPDDRKRWSMYAYDRHGTELIRQLFPYPKSEVEGGYLSPDGRVAMIFTRSEITLIRLPDAPTTGSLPATDLPSLAARLCLDLLLENPIFKVDPRWLGIRRLDE